MFDDTRSDTRSLYYALNYSGTHILFCKKEKKTLDLQIFSVSRIGKTMKKLQRIPSTIVSTSALVIFS